MTQSMCKTRTMAVPAVLMQRMCRSDTCYHCQCPSLILSDTDAVAGDCACLIARKVTFSMDDILLDTTRCGGMSTAIEHGRRGHVGSDCVTRFILDMHFQG